MNQPLESTPLFVALTSPTPRFSLPAMVAPREWVERREYFFKILCVRTKAEGTWGFYVVADDVVVAVVYMLCVAVVGVHV